MRNIRDVISTPSTFPIEVTVTTGQSFLIEHPDFTYVHPVSGDVWHFPTGGPIVVIDPAHIVKVVPKGTPPPF